MVEDDRATSSALRAIFVRRGWEVLLASTIAEARALLSPRPDWVILDLMLPDGDGARLLEQIRGEGLSMRVAVTTGLSDARRLADIAGLRPDAVLAKPINLDDLLRALGLA